MKLTPGFSHFMGLSDLLHPALIYIIDLYDILKKDSLHLSFKKLIGGFRCRSIRSDSKGRWSHFLCVKPYTYIANLREFLKDGFCVIFNTRPWGHSRQDGGEGLHGSLMGIPIERKNYGEAHLSLLKPTVKPVNWTRESLFTDTGITWSLADDLEKKRTLTIKTLSYTIWYHLHF